MKVKNLFKNIGNKIKKTYFICLDFIIENKIYFIIGISSIILFIIPIIFSKMVF